MDRNRLAEGLEARWFDPRTAEWQDAADVEDGRFELPDNNNWVLVLQ